MPNPYNDYTPPTGGGGLFLKFEDGKSYKLRILSEPLRFYAQFSPDSPIQTKYAWTVYDYEEGKARILQLPVTAFRQIWELAKDEDWGDPTRYDLKITRTGSGLETKYSVIPGNKGITPLAVLDSAKDVDLNKALGGKAVPLSVPDSEVPAPSPGDKASPSVSAPSTDAPPVESREPEGDDFGTPEVDLSEIPF